MHDAKRKGYFESHNGSILTSIDRSPKGTECSNAKTDEADVEYRKAFAFIFNVRVTIDDDRDIQVCEGVLGCGDSNLGCPLLYFIKTSREHFIISLFSDLEV